VNNIHYMIIGTAGAPLYSLSTAPYVLKSVRDYNYAIVDVSPVSFKMVVYNDRGAVLDSLTLTKTTRAKPAKPGSSEGYLLRRVLPTPSLPELDRRSEEGISARTGSIPNHIATRVQTGRRGS
jgi:hypothetical protein